MTNPRTVLLVCRRPDHGRRDLLWRYARHRWMRDHPDWPIFEGEHLDGPFNRSAAINAAARDAGDWDVAVVIDADVVIDPEQVRVAVHNAHHTGRLTFPYQRYVPLGEQITNEILDRGTDRDWVKGVDRRHGVMDARVGKAHVSSVVVVPRRLWDDVGGFDERFEGWGCEDVAFAHACDAVGGGIDRIDGDVFHLWHPPSKERDLRSPLYLAGSRLAARYHRYTTRDDMLAFLARRDDPTVDDEILMVVVGNGRRELLSDAIRSATRHVTGPIAERVIVDDTGDPGYQEWLRHEFPTFRVEATRRRGYDVAMQTVWRVARKAALPWVFTMEEDFTFNRDVDLAAMTRVLASNPHLTQMALRRQPWFPKEVEAGGIIERHPDRYTDRSSSDGNWLEHSVFWTTNPQVTPLQIILDHPWPSGADSERRFGRAVNRRGRLSGYWGKRTDDPWITHHGYERVGTRY